jgi:GH24 family phage-related lysozyme (muramidase)
MNALKSIQASKTLQSLSVPETKELQKTLSVLGYDIGPIDGVLGNKTKKAWISFKEKMYMDSPETIGPGSISVLLEQFQQATSNKQASYVDAGTPKIISPLGIRALANREGKRNSKYRDSVGLWTIGIGHLIQPGESFPEVMTDQEVYDLFRKDLKRYEDPINKNVTVPLTQNMYDALVSFVFNIGVNGFIGSTALRKLNQKDYKGAADAMLMWNKPPEIMGRRESEVKQFLS